MSNRKVAEVFPPGEFIKDALEERNWSQIELAEIIGRTPNVVNELIKGKRTITPETAKALGEAFDTSAQLWMNLESMYQLWRVKDTDNVIAHRAKLYGKAPVKEMTKRHWIEYSEDIVVLEHEILKHFEIKNIDDKIAYPLAARKSGGEEITPAQWAWFFRVKHLASSMQTKAFSIQSLNDCLKQLRSLLPDVYGIRHIPRILADAGIRFLIIEHLPNTKIDGVALWLDKKSPAIALSLRYDRIDFFWFTLLHELSHIQNEDGINNNIMLDIDLVGEDLNEQNTADIEKKADFYAANFLINQASLDNFITRTHPFYRKDKIIGFAITNKVHPGIVVGQLQHKKEIPYGTFRPFLEKVKHIITPATLTDGWRQIIPTD